MVGEHAHKIKGKVISASIEKRVDLTAEHFKIWLRPSEPFEFESGQYCTLGVDGIERPYSIVSSPSEELLELFVERIPPPEGHLTPLLHAPSRFVARNGVTCLNCASNNYLDLAGHPRLRQRAAEALEQDGTSSGGSRLLGGDLIGAAGPAMLGNRQAQMTAQGVVLILGAEKALGLEDRHDLLTELGEDAGLVDTQDEAVHRAADEPALDLVGDGLGRADEVRSPAPEPLGGLA